MQDNYLETTRKDLEITKIGFKTTRTSFEIIVLKLGEKILIIPTIDLYCSYLKSTRAYMKLSPLHTVLYATKMLYIFLETRTALSRATWLIIIYSTEQSIPPPIILVLCAHIICVLVMNSCWYIYVTVGQFSDDFRSNSNSEIVISSFQPKKLSVKSWGGW